MSDRYTFATGNNANFIESLYQSFRKDPSSVEGSWRKFFEGYEFALSVGEGRFGQGEAHDHAKVEALINAYRRLGHLWADLNPLAKPAPLPEEMQPAHHGLGDVSPTSKFLPSNFGGAEMTLDEIIRKLTRTYCGTIGADYREIHSIDAVVWLQEQMEGCENHPPLSADLQHRIFAKLTEADGFEKFLQTRYLGQKRFSLEGVDSLIPLLDVVFDEAARIGCEEACLGMAHRGRLNVLANIMQKPYKRMLAEFEGGEPNPFDIDGDVKYHLGYANEVATISGKTMRLYLSPNPSHLEAVDPVVEGFTRCRQELLGGAQGRSNKVLPILLHGDASFIGQGLVAETLNLSELPAYSTGGTIHVIVNNQIGFTTSPDEAKSCSYSSDISKLVRAPVLHVNADDPEAVAWVGKLAVMYRERFKKDVVIDLIGYRRHGHNETDEPSFTQPLMYKAIAAHPSVHALYERKLTKSGVLTAQQASDLGNQLKDKLQEAYEQVHGHKVSLPPMHVPASLQKVFAYRRVDRKEVMTGVDTTVPDAVLKTLAEQITSTPDDFALHPKLKRIYGQRQQMVDGDGQIDWAFAELLAFASLAKEGFSVRLSGQDCKRGTFSSRHGVVFDYENGKSFEPLNTVKPGKVTIINSPLSELGCLGFEFGYSIANPEALVLWEAQFGDFANGAQILIDQFLVASEAKWQQTSGLVLLLPHGYEGMGPEHSSARPERFLQCCGNLNIQVCNVTTPAQLFHLLRRQLHRNFRKPLVLMTPKSLLRHPKVVSPLVDFSKKQFSEVLDEGPRKSHAKAEKLLMCTGKIYYELLASKEANPQLEEVPILRLEQLYPFPSERLEAIFASYPQLKEIVWVQEEPQNMGAWTFVSSRLREIFRPGMSLKYVGRKNSGSTAEGSAKSHQLEQKRILDEAFNLVCAWEPRLAQR